MKPLARLIAIVAGSLIALALIAWRDLRHDDGTADRLTRADDATRAEHARRSRIATARWADEDRRALERGR